MIGRSCVNRLCASCQSFLKLQLTLISKLSISVEKQLVESMLSFRPTGEGKVLPKACLVFKNDGVRGGAPAIAPVEASLFMQAP